jgi:segregation and condensation protein A
MSDDPREPREPHATEDATAPAGVTPPAPAGDASIPGQAAADAALAGAARRPSVTIKLARFEGPLDLLLHLIKRDEIDIYDIPITRITEQYLAYLELMRALDLDVAGEFLVMAATLMRIKSRMLLPLPPKDEEEDEGDPREELVQRLIEYRQFKEAATQLKGHEELRRRLYERGMVPGEDEAGPLPLAPATLFDLLDALNRVLARVPEQVVYEVRSEAYDVDDKMEMIRGLVNRQRSVSFFTLLERCHVRAEMIVTFIALLELIKLGLVVVIQIERFGDVSIVARPAEGGDEHAPVESARDA